jgi:hypothetical protein
MPVAVRVAEVSFPSTTEGTIRRDVVFGDDQVRDTSGDIFLANVFDGKLAGWVDDADAAVGVGVKDFHGVTSAEDRAADTNVAICFSKTPELAVTCILKADVVVELQVACWSRCGLFRSAIILSER